MLVSSRLNIPLPFTSTVPLLGDDPDRTPVKLTFAESVRFTVPGELKNPTRNDEASDRLKRIVPALQLSVPVCPAPRHHPLEPPKLPSPLHTWQVPSFIPIFPLLSVPPAMANCPPFILIALLPVLQMPAITKFIVAPMVRSAFRLTLALCAILKLPLMMLLQLTDWAEVPFATRNVKLLNERILPEPETERFPL